MSLNAGSIAVIIIRPKSGVIYAKRKALHCNQGGVSKLKFYFVYIFYLLTLGNTEKT